MLIEDFIKEIEEYKRLGNTPVKYVIEGWIDINERKRNYNKTAIIIADHLIELINQGDIQFKKHTPLEKTQQIIDESKKYEYEICQYCIYNGNCKSDGVVQESNKYDEYDFTLRCESGIFRYFKEKDKPELVIPLNKMAKYRPRFIVQEENGKMKTVEEIKEIIKQEYPEAVKVEKITEKPVKFLDEDSHFIWADKYELTDKEGNKWEVGWKRTDQEADSEQNNL